VAITPDGKYVYVTNDDGAVAVISTATNSVTANITIASLTATTTIGGISMPSGSSLPQAVAITPNGEYAYVACADGAISAINTSTNTVEATINLGYGDTPNALAITPNGEYAYVCVGTSNSSMISVISTATNTVTATIVDSAAPSGVAITPDGKYAYVTNYFNDSVSVINTATNTVDQTVTVGSSPYGIAITPNGEYAYVTNLVSVATQSPVADWVGSVSVISTATNTAPTASSSPAVPEFPTQSLTVALLVGIIIVFSIVIIAMKKAEKSNSAKISQEKTSNSKNSTDQQSNITFFSIFLIRR
jgi:YVTN family beta-propeller protein